MCPVHENERGFFMERSQKGVVIFDKYEKINYLNLLFGDVIYTIVSWSGQERTRLFMPPLVITFVNC